LLRIKDPVKRKALEQRALKEGLTKYDLRPLIKELSGRDGKTAKALPPLVRPTDLRIGTYKRVDTAATLDTGHLTLEKRVRQPPASVKCRVTSVHELDLGFFFTLPVTKTRAATVTITETPSFTYAAEVIRVVDGDTLYVNILLGFGAKCKEKLRLRGINTPELGTPEGERAKKYVAELLPAGALIVLKSHKCKTDTYGRFVADIFYKAGADESERIIESGEYLNQELLDRGFAVRMKE
jgi:endonuclease YncB( thermonuclease family)